MTRQALGGLLVTSSSPKAVGVEKTSLVSTFRRPRPIITMTLLYQHSQRDDMALEVSGA